MPLFYHLAQGKDKSRIRSRLPPRCPFVCPPPFARLSGCTVSPKYIQLNGGRESGRNRPDSLAQDEIPLLTISNDRDGCPLGLAADDLVPQLEQQAIRGSLASHGYDHVASRQSGVL